jgi:hypothetical protein
VKSASEVPTKSVSKASIVISAAPRVDLAFCMAVMTRVPSLQRLEISSCLLVGKEHSGAALRKDFDFGELRYRRSGRNREGLSTGRARCGGPGESFSDVILRIAGQGDAA